MRININIRRVIKEPTTFFIAGPQRSGTTLLSVILARHPDVMIGVNSYGFRLVSCFGNLKRVLPFNLDRSEQEIQAWLIENDYKNRLSELIRPSEVGKFKDQQSLIASEIEQSLSREGKQIFGDKVPNMEQFFPDLKLLIPQAKVIHMVRDGRDCASSHSERTMKNVYLAANEWKEGNIAGLYNQARVGESDYLMIRFEDLLLKQEETLRKVCGFLDISFVEEMLEPADDEKNSYVKTEIDFSKVRKFERSLSKRKIRKIEKIQGPLLHRFGYELAHPEYKDEHTVVHPLKVIWWRQNDALKQLFRSKVEGMVEHDVKQVTVPFKTRLKTFAFTMGRDLFPELLFRYFFRRRWIKQDRMNDDSSKNV